jgi:uncharacterized protein (DUF4415 family)
VSKKSIKSNLAKIDQMADADIDLSDIPELTEEQVARMVRVRSAGPKVAVSLRLDPRVIEWLKSKGEGHLTRINDILVNLMEAETSHRQSPPR